MAQHIKEGKGEVRDQVKEFLPLRRVPPRLREATIDDFPDNAPKAVEPDYGGMQIEELDDEDEEDAFISIGIDFGTTYSGIAWSLSTSPKDIHITSTWDTDMPSSSDLHKVPSVLTYNSKGEVTSWGYRLDSHRHHISWFKLGISEYGSQKLAQEQPERSEMLKSLATAFQKEPVEVVGDYLRCLWTHATESIQTNIGRHLWENLKMKIVLTVPAIWDHKAQELTRKAAEMGGLLARSDTTLELIGEPEAAALAVFDEMSVQKKRSLQVGDSFVVCDAGGGTVDLISYTIESIKPLKLAMCSESTGGMCGAIFLDGAFEKQIRTMISAEDYEKLGTRSKRKMMNDWEYGIKRGFRIDAAEHRKWFVDIPGFLGLQVPETSNFEFSASRDSLLSPLSFDQLRVSSPIPGGTGSRISRIDPGSLVLKTGHLNAIFSEVCSKIKDLVGEQLSVVECREGKQAVAILLVGGFGENIYLRQELDRSFSHVEIQQPTKAWAAICRGAVLKGLGNELVVNHISKYNYGSACQADFNKDLHLEIDRKMDQIRKVDVADNQMKWFLKRGENVEKEEPVTHSFFYATTKASGLKSFSIQIFYSESIFAELRVDPSVKPLCRLKISFDPSIFEELPIRMNGKGEEWRKLDFVIEMQVSSGELCWSAKYKGAETGSVKTIVGYEGMTKD